MLIYPSSQDVYPIGSMIRSQAPPNNKWERCYGQIVAQADYSKLYNMMLNPHSLRWSNWEYKYMFTVNDPSFTAMLFNGSVYVAFGYGILAYSSNLEDWTEVTRTGYWYGGAVGGSTFLIVSYNSTNAATSSNGVDWVSKTLPASKYWYWCCWDGTYFYVTASGGYNKIIRSTDGTAWEEISGPSLDTSGYMGYSGIASDGDGTIVALHNASAIGTSVDSGVTWRVITSPSSVKSLDYVNGRFIVACWNGCIGVSEDGFEWEYVQTFATDKTFFNTSVEANAPSKWVYANNMYLGIDGQDSSIRFMLYSYDLKTFYPILKPTDGDRYNRDAIWDSANQRWFMIGPYQGVVNYLTECAYDKNTHFQFPLTGGHRQEQGEQWYIRVR